MSRLVVTRALPNPLGKDHAPHQRPTNDKLNEEWIEFGNAGAQAASIDDHSIGHYTFTSACAKTGEDTLMTFSGGLQPGTSVRLHTGTGVRWVDGSVVHLYAGRSNFVWNNACGDTAVLRGKDGNWIDYASYNPRPRNGVILKRVPGTNTLTETGAIAA